MRVEGVVGHAGLAKGDGAVPGEMDLEGSQAGACERVRPKHRNRALPVDQARLGTGLECLAEMPGDWDRCSGGDQQEDGGYSGDGLLACQTTIRIPS